MRARRAFAHTSFMRRRLLVVTTILISGTMLAGCRRPIMGAAINTQYFGDSSYTAVAGQKFDIVTPEGEMKWAATEPARNQFNFGPGDQIMQFANAHHQQVHGHNLVNAPKPAANVLQSQYRS
jgi:GH35 family endo-1,4-beta-xylanase